MTAGADVTALVATYTSTGASVDVGTQSQTSAITDNDFTAAVDYTVTASDSSTPTPPVEPCLTLLNWALGISAA